MKNHRNLQRKFQSNSEKKSINNSQEIPKIVPEKLQFQKKFLRKFQKNYVGDGKKNSARIPRE